MLYFIAGGSVSSRRLFLSLRAFRCGTLPAALIARPPAALRLRPAQLLQRAVCERMPRGRVADVRYIQLVVVSSRAC